MNRPKLLRWLTPRFSLRTLFVLVTAAALVAWWVNSQLNWIRQRKEFAGNNPIVLMGYGQVRAPGLLWLFGEKGSSEVGIQIVDPWMHEKARLAWPDEPDDREYRELQEVAKAAGLIDGRDPLVEEAKRLYPEATRIRNLYLAKDPREAQPP